MREGEESLVFWKVVQNTRICAIIVNNLKPINHLRDFRELNLSSEILFGSLQQLNTFHESISGDKN